MRRPSISPLWISTVLLLGCARASIDSSQVAAVSNDDTYAMLDHIWAGVRTTITSAKEPQTSPFTLTLSGSPVCPGGGQQTYQGTLTGTNTNGAGTANLSLTATLTKCVFDDLVATRTITTPSVTVTGTIAIANDAYGLTNLHMTSPGATLNGTTCEGGIDMTITAASPTSQPTATGTACGRSGTVPLP
jgi:hypothetical protein